MNESTGTPTGLGSVAAVRLVAGRELRTRLRSKAYLIITAVLVVIVVALVLVAKLVSGSHSVLKVGVLPDAAPVARSLQAAGVALGEELDVVRVTGPDEARRELDAGTLDAVVVAMRGTTLGVLVTQTLDPKLRVVLVATASQSVLNDQIRTLGGDPEAVHARVAAAGIEVNSLEPAPAFDPQRLAVGFIAGILVYLALMLTGQLIAQGVVEEKSSRVVELLLSTIRPWQLLAGKVVGIGLVGLLQVVLVGVAGLVAGQLTGVLTIPWAVVGGALGWLVLWFVLGFTMYALVFAGLGALVSRQEEVGGVVTPATALLVIGYVIGVSVLPSDPENQLVAVLSLLPVFSPTLMPIRLAMGEVPVWQIATALVLAVVTIPLLVAITARMYRNAVIRSGSRVRLREAIRAG